MSSKLELITTSLKNEKYLINTNTSLTNHPYPCLICLKNVNQNQKAMFCNSCNNWIHIKCEGMTEKDYNTQVELNSHLNDDEIEEQKWYCIKCIIKENAENLPFGLETSFELTNINKSNSMQIYDILPSFEIQSEVSKIPNHSTFDIDENIEQSINCKYYSVDQFQKMNDRDSFNIFHSNVNGFDSDIHFSNLFQLISKCGMDFDIINISETSQQVGENFVKNIDLNGYKQPFTTETNSGKGGVLLYIKEKYESFERNDLKIRDDDYEGVWAEITNEKSKNIVCGCIYRHPSANSSTFNVYIRKCLSILQKEDKEVYISGDFNIDLLKYNSNNYYKEFYDLMTSYVFLPLINDPTRVTETTATIIDNIYTNTF